MRLIRYARDDTLLYATSALLPAVRNDSLSTLCLNSFFYLLFVLSLFFALKDSLNSDLSLSLLNGICLIYSGTNL